MPFRLHLNSKEHSIHSQTTTSAVSSHSQSGLRLLKRWPRREAQYFRVRACFSAAPGPCNRLPVPRRECNSRKPFQEEPRPTSSQTIRSGERVEKATRSLWSPTTWSGDRYVLDFAPPRDVSGDTLWADSSTVLRARR